MAISPALIKVSSRCKNDCDGHIEYNQMVLKSCALLISGPLCPRASAPGEWSARAVLRPPPDHWTLPCLLGHGESKYGHISGSSRYKKDRDGHAE